MHQRNIPFGHVKATGQERNQRLVCLTVHRRSRQSHADTAIRFEHQRIAARLRLHADIQSYRIDRIHGESNVPFGTPFSLRGLSTVFALVSNRRGHSAFRASTAKPTRHKNVKTPSGGQLSCARARLTRIVRSRTTTVSTAQRKAECPTVGASRSRSEAGPTKSSIPLQKKTGGSRPPGNISAIAKSYATPKGLRRSIPRNIPRANTRHRLRLRRRTGVRPLRMARCTKYSYARPVTCLSSEFAPCRDTFVKQTGRFISHWITNVKQKNSRSSRCGHRHFQNIFRRFCASGGMAYNGRQ